MSQQRARTNNTYRRLLTALFSFSLILLGVLAFDDQSTNYRQYSFNPNSQDNVGSLDFGNSLAFTWSDTNNNGQVDSYEFVSHYTQFNFTENISAFKARMTHDAFQRKRNYECTPVVDDFDGDGKVEFIIPSDTTTLTMYAYNLTTSSLQQKGIFSLPSNFLSSCPVEFFNGTKKLIIANLHDNGGVVIINVTNGLMAQEAQVENGGTCGLDNQIICATEPGTNLPFCAYPEFVLGTCNTNIGVTDSAGSLRLGKIYLHNYSLMDTASTTARTLQSGLRGAGRKRNSTVYEISENYVSGTTIIHRKFDTTHMTSICSVTIATATTAQCNEIDDSLSSFAYLDTTQTGVTSLSGLGVTVVPVCNNGAIASYHQIQIDENCNIKKDITLNNMNRNFTDVFGGIDFCSNLGKNGAIAMLYQEGNSTRMSCTEALKSGEAFVDLGNVTTNSTFLGRSSYIAYNELISGLPDQGNPLYIFSNAGIFRLTPDYTVTNFLGFGKVAVFLAFPFIPRTLFNETYNLSRATKRITDDFITNGSVFPVDIDGDRVLDIFVLNNDGFGQSSVYISNQGNSYPNVTKYTGACTPVCKNLNYPMTITVTDEELNDVNLTVDCKGDGFLQSVSIPLTTTLRSNTGTVYCNYNSTGFFQAYFNVSDTFHENSTHSFTKLIQVVEQNESCVAPTQLCSEDAITIEQQQQLNSQTSNVKHLDISSTTDSLTSYACGSDYRGSFCAHGLWLFIIMVLLFAVFYGLVLLQIKNPMLFFVAPIPVYFLLIYATIKDYLPVFYLFFVLLMLAFGVAKLFNKSGGDGE